MKGRVHLVLALLAIGVCREISAQPGNVKVRVYDKATEEEMTAQLREMLDNRAQLQAAVDDVNQTLGLRRRAQQDLDSVNKWILHLEKRLMVRLTDFNKVVDKREGDFEKEKEKLRKELNKTEKLKEKALNVIEKLKTEDKTKIENLQNKIEFLDKQKNEIAEIYAQVTEKQQKQIENKDKKIKKVLKEREAMRKELEKAQNLHSQALEAMAIATQEGYKPISIPHQNEIDELRAEMKRYQDQESSLQSTDPIYGLITMQNKLRELLEILYTEGEIPTDAARKEMEEELVQLEKETVRERDEHDNRRKNILQVIRDKGFTGYGEDEISWLQLANHQVQEKNKRLQRIARRSAYLAAISQVNNLLNECSDEIDEVIERHAQGKKRQEDQEETSGNEDRESFEDPETLYDTIHQKYLLYKDLNELYRTKLSTGIVNGLSKVNMRLPVPFPTCDMKSLLTIRDQVGEWADGVQYALRLTKSLNKGGNRSLIARFFLKFLKNIRNAFRTLLGKKIVEETNLEDDESRTTSIEIFENQESINFAKHFEYIDNHLDVLDADKALSHEKLGLFRYNFIVLKEVPEEIQQRALGMYQGLADDPSETNRARLSKDFQEVLKEIEAAEMNLRKVFDTIMTGVNSSFKRKVQEYQKTRQEFNDCRYNIFKNMPVFKNFGKKEEKNGENKS